jgi:hypothetical protein
MRGQPWKMKARSVVWRMLLLLSLTFASGCATHALWTKTNLEAFNEPADDSSLRVFNAERQKDWLVVYDEYSERSDSIRTRAYFLNQNRKRIEQRRCPDFVGTNSMRGLKPVPVFPATNAPGTNLPPSFFILAETNNLSFTLYDGARAIGSYAMPVYNDGKARVVRIALTPVTVVADITIVGGCVGYWFICGLAQSGYSTTFH